MNLHKFCQVLSLLTFDDIPDVVYSNIEVHIRIDKENLYHLTTKEFVDVTVTGIEYKDGILWIK